MTKNQKRKTKTNLNKPLINRKMAEREAGQAQKRKERSQWVQSRGR